MTWIIILMIVGGGILAIAQDRRDRIRISEYLRARDCVVLSISKAYHYSERDGANAVYKVSYRDSKKRFHHTKCKITHRVFFPNEIFWEEGAF